MYFVNMPEGKKCQKIYEYFWSDCIDMLEGMQICVESQKLAKNWCNVIFINLHFCYNL